MKFYQKVFGWKIEKWSGPFNYWLVTTGEDKEPGINGAIVENTDDNFKNSINTVGVPSVDAFVKKIVDAGGRVIAPKGTSWDRDTSPTLQTLKGTYSEYSRLTRPPDDQIPFFSVLR